MNNLRTLSLLSLSLTVSTTWGGVGVRGGRGVPSSHTNTILFAPPPGAAMVVVVTTLPSSAVLVVVVTLGVPDWGVSVVSSHSLISSIGSVLRFLVFFFLFFAWISARPMSTVTPSEVTRRPPTSNLVMGNNEIVLNDQVIT